MSLHSQLLNAPERHGVTTHHPLHPTRAQVSKRVSKCDCANCGVRLVVDVNMGRVRNYLGTHQHWADGVFHDGLFEYECPICEYAGSVEEERTADFEEEVSFR